MEGLVQDISIYNRRCLKCEVVHRYQEWTDGLRNFNGRVIITLQLMSVPEAQSPDCCIQMLGIWNGSSASCARVGCTKNVQENLTALTLSTVDAPISLNH